VGVALAASALVLTACSSNSGGSTTASSKTITQADITKALNTPTTITFWSWLPDIQNEVNLFEKQYPKIKVNYTNAGQGTPEYTKLRTVLKAGSGQPDVVQVEYQYISSFQSDLLNLAPYGGSGLQSQFTPAVWKQVAIDGAVYGVPQDTSPMGNLYRTDILQQAGITTAPTTWTQYMADAKTIKAKTGSFISDLPPNDGAEFLAYLWQNGARPFNYDGKKTIKVDLDSPQSEQVVSYWQSMLDQGLVDNAPDFTSDWFQGFAKNKYAGWLVPSWGPDQLIGSVANTSGKWRAAPLPNWDASKPTSSFWGGSSDAVPKSTKNPIAAYTLAKWLNTNHTSVSMETLSSQSLYPASVYGLTNPKWISAKVPFFGGQQVNKIFSNITKTIDPNFGWLPYMDYVYTQYSNTLGKAIANKTSMLAGLKAWQAAVANYGKQQGFTVTTS